MVIRCSLRKAPVPGYNEQKGDDGGGDGTMDCFLIIKSSHDHHVACSSAFTRLVSSSSAPS